MLSWSRLLAVTALFTVACAEGGSLAGPAGGGSVGGSDGAGGDNTGAGSTDDTTTSTTSNPTNTTTTMNTGAGGDGGSMAEGGSAADGGSASDGGGGPGPTCNYTAPETCETAELVAPLAGDSGNPMVMRTGDTSKFYRVRIEEQSSSVSETDLSYQVRLTSPPGMNYDLRVYQGPQAGGTNCNATPKTGTGSPESVADSWDDDQGFGGEDDSVWLVIEVVYVSGDTCGSSSLWTLQILGNT